VFKHTLHHAKTQQHDYDLLNPDTLRRSFVADSAGKEI